MPICVQTIKLNEDTIMLQASQPNNVTAKKKKGGYRQDKNPRFIRRELIAVVDYLRAQEDMSPTVSELHDLLTAWRNHNGGDSIAFGEEGYRGVSLSQVRELADYAGMSISTVEDAAAHSALALMEMLAGILVRVCDQVDLIVDKALPHDTPTLRNSRPYESLKSIVKQIAACNDAATNPRRQTAKAAAEVAAEPPKAGRDVLVRATPGVKRGRGPDRSPRQKSPRTVVAATGQLPLPLEDGSLAS